MKRIILLSSVICLIVCGIFGLFEMWELVFFYQFRHIFLSLASSFQFPSFPCAIYHLPSLSLLRVFFFSQSSCHSHLSPISNQPGCLLFPLTLVFYILSPAATTSVFHFMSVLFPPLFRCHGLLPGLSSFSLVL